MAVCSARAVCRVVCLHGRCSCSACAPWRVAPRAPCMPTSLQSLAAPHMQTMAQTPPPKRARGLPGSAVAVAQPLSGPPPPSPARAQEQSHEAPSRALAGVPVESPQHVSEAAVQLAGKRDRAQLGSAAEPDGATARAQVQAALNLLRPPAQPNKTYEEPPEHLAAVQCWQVLADLQLRLLRRTAQFRERETPGANAVDWGSSDSDEAQD